MLPNGVPQRDDLTGLLRAARAGCAGAWDELVTRVYPDLRAMARVYLRCERRDHTLPATALVNEAYLRLVGDRAGPWECRGQFFAICATTLRRILVEHARARRRRKRGVGWTRITLDDGAVTAGEPAVDVVALDEALDRLSRLDPVRAQVVELRYFGGMSVRQTAEYLGVSVPTVVRYWRLARAWLYRELNPG